MQYVSLLAEKKREERASVAVTEGPPASAGTTAKETNATTAATAKTGESPREISGASEAASCPSLMNRIDADIATAQEQRE